MLTRSQVARRLGKSLATVRRLEGSSLHPSRDDNGVHWFDESEVQRLADNRRTTRRSPGRAGHQPRESGDRVERSDWWIQRLEHVKPAEVAARPDPEQEERRGARDPATSLEVERLESRVRGLEDQLAYHAAAKIRAARTEARERETIACQLLTELDGLSDRQLRQLGPRTVRGVIDLINEALAAR
jgi:hypothetical protein